MDTEAVILVLMMTCSLRRDPYKIRGLVAFDGDLDGSPDNQQPPVADDGKHLHATIPHQQPPAISSNQTRSNLKSAAMASSTGLKRCAIMPQTVS